MANQQERNQLVYEMLLQCDTQEQREAALHLVCFLWDKNQKAGARDAVLLALMGSYQAKERESWCLAVLRLGCYGMISDLQRHGYRFREALSGFDEACSTFDVYGEDPKKGRTVKRRLATKTRLEARREERESERQQRLGEKLNVELLAHSLADVFAGTDHLLDIDEDQARRILEGFVGYAILPQDVGPLLDKLYRPKVVKDAAGRKDRKSVV